MDSVKNQAQTTKQKKVDFWEHD